MLKKLSFYHYLSVLPDDSLAKEIFNLQKENSLPGLVSECSELLSLLDVELEPSFYTKVQWKKLISSQIHKKNKDDILNLIKPYKKLSYEKIINEEYGQKTYMKNMNVSQARTFFAIRAQTLRTVQMNFKHKPEYVLNQWKCSCGEDDIQSHLPHCLSYEHLREGLNLEESDHDLVLYFQRVIREREREADRDGDSQSVSEEVRERASVHSTESQSGRSEGTGRLREGREGAAGQKSRH